MTGELCWGGGAFFVTDQNTTIVEADKVLRESLL